MNIACLAPKEGTHSLVEGCQAPMSRQDQGTRQDHCPKFASSFQQVNSITSASEPPSPSPFLTCRQTDANTTNFAHHPHRSALTTPKQSIVAPWLMPTTSRTTQPPANYSRPSTPQETQMLRRRLQRTSAVRWLFNLVASHCSQNSLTSSSRPLDLL